MLPLAAPQHRQTGNSSGVTLVSTVVYTPTFVVVDNGREIGRITGYINDDAFWGLLGTFVAKLEPSHPPSTIPARRSTLPRFQ